MTYDDWYDEFIFINETLPDCKGLSRKEIEERMPKSSFENYYKDGITPSEALTEEFSCGNITDDSI